MPESAWWILRQNQGAETRDTPQPLPAQRQWLQIMGVFGAGPRRPFLQEGPPRLLFRKLNGFATSSSPGRLLAIWAM